MPALQYGGPVPSGACQMPGHVDRRSPSASGATPAHTYSRTYNASSAFQFDPRWSAAANASSIDSTPAESFEYLLDAACDSGSDDYELVKYPETIADNTTADGAATETGSEAMLAEISESNAETTTPQEATPVNSVDSVSAIGTSASGVHTPAASDDAVPAKISETITDVTTTEAIT